MEPMREQIAENIRKFRKQKGMSADEVGKIVGKSGKTISAWERGQGQPDADELVSLCLLFGVGISDFYSSVPSGSDGLTPEEQKLMSLLPYLNSTGIARLIEEAEMMSESSRYGSQGR